MVSTRLNGVCVIFRKLKFTSAVFLKCTSFLLLPRSTASHSESLSVLAMISECLIWLNFNISAIRFPVCMAAHHSIPSASPLDVAVVACLLVFHSSRYVLPFCPASTINLSPSLRGSFFYIFPHIVAIRDERQVVRDCVVHVSHKVFELCPTPILPLVQVATKSRQVLLQFCFCSSCRMNGVTQKLVVLRVDVELVTRKLGPEGNSFVLLC